MENNKRCKGLSNVLSADTDTHTCTHTRTHTAGPAILTVGYLEFRLNHPTEITREEVEGGRQKGEISG